MTNADFFNTPYEEWEMNPQIFKTFLHNRIDNLCMQLKVIVELHPECVERLLLDTKVPLDDKDYSCIEICDGIAYLVESD